MKTVRIVACQTFRKEILKSLESTPNQEFEVISFLPLCYETIGDNFLTTLFDNNTLNIILACPELTQIIEGFPSNKNIKLHSFSHCCDLLINRELIEYFQQTEAYIVTPGWLEHWEVYAGLRNRLTL